MAAHAARDFRRDPLSYFDDQLRSAGDSFWLPFPTLCVAEPKAAKGVLANPDGLFEEHSDFFHTRRGPFGPRPLQAAIGRAARELLAGHAAARAGDLPASIERVLGAASEWPDAGNVLIYRHLLPALVTPGAAARVGRTIDEVLQRGVLAGARERRSRVARAFFRRRVFRELTREIERRVEERGGEAAAAPRDLFDVLSLFAGKAARTSDLGELYLPFLFAVAGSVGFTLGWSVYLLGTHPPTDAATGWIVREALRLWPIAWQMVRRPARAHEVAGAHVTPRNEVLVCPYVTHRHPRFWSEPGRFLPERWADERSHLAFMPFGWGPHTCAAAALSLEIVEDVLAILRRDYRLTVSPHTHRPFIGPSLAPPRFRLDLTPKAS